MADVHVIVDDCTTVGGSDVRAIRSRDGAGGSANWHFNPERVVAGLPDKLDDRQMDWLEINSAIFAADRAVPRDPGLGWNRSIELHVPVRDPAFWSDHSAAFEDIFSSLTYDRLALSFHHASTFRDAPRPRSKPFPDADCIALLSGGLDSFTGAVELHGAGSKPLFLAGSGSGATNSSQASVFRVVEKLDPTREMLKLVCKRKAGFPGDEASQRSRSLLFVSSAALVATALGFEDLYVNENGVMAVHVPLTAARLGSFSTRTAVPRVLNQMATLAATALGAPVKVQNALIGMTKSEVAERAKALGHARDVDKTVSCWSISHHSSTHCGYCAPCVMRRLACLDHGIADVKYELDVLADPASLNKEDAKDTLVHFVQLADEFDTRSDFDLEVDHPELINGASGLGTIATLALYRRWAGEVLAAFTAHPVPASLMS
jgi:7-cyano-7-deazaguanine synthase in queuosine biosynthesis